MNQRRFFSATRSKSVPSAFTKAWALAGAVALVAMSSASAVVIDFTTAEGYSAGTLNGQPSGSSSWATSGSNSFFTVVPTGGGSVQVNINGSGGVLAAYQTPVDFTSGIAYTSYLDFSFVQSVDVFSGQTSFFASSYTTNPAGGNITGVVAGFGRQDGTDLYRLAFASGGVNIVGTDLGINSGANDRTSDVIRLVYTLQQGATATTWIGTESIYNMTTGALVATRSSSTISVGLAAGDTSLYNALVLSSAASASGLSSFTILGYSSPVAVPEPATYALLIAGGLVWALRRTRRTA